MSAVTTEITAPVLAGRAGPAPDLTTLRTSDGTVLALREIGPTSPVTTGSASTVIMIHGWTLDHTMWDDVADRLALLRPDLRIIGYDHRGHGWSDAGPEPTGFARITADLVELIDDRAPEGRVVLAGHSLGGMTIMALYELYPDLARRLVVGNLLVATSAGELGRSVPGIPGWLVSSVRRAQEALWSRQEGSSALVTSEDPRAIATALRFAPGPKPDWSAADVNRTAAMIGRSHPATTASLGRELLAHDRIAAVELVGQVPTTVLGGGKDVLCPPSHARRMAAAAEGSELVVFSRAGHMLPFERRDEVAGHVVRVLERAELAAAREERN